MNYDKALKKTARYAENYYRENPQPELTYHNADHTRYVVKCAEKIAAYNHLADTELFIVLAAAWLHDLGCVHRMEGHEEASATIARECLEDIGLDESIIAQVVRLILVTQRKEEPADLLEEVILDADTAHVGKKSFLKKSELLRKERELTGKTPVPVKDWYQQTIGFLEAHRFYTVYGKTLLNEQKLEHLAHLKALLSRYERNAALTPVGMLSKSAERAEKSIDTAFRIASQNNQRLSSLADNKAHILITVNSIILSAVISLVLRKLQEYEHLIIPTFILLTISLLTMVLAIITTRPTVSKGTFTPGDLEEKKINLLFFGNYFKMLPEEYTGGMWMMLDDKVYLYNSIMLDIYYQGRVIGRKYYFLRLAYNIFMWGVVAAVIAFFAAALIHDSTVAGPHGPGL